MGVKEDADRLFAMANEMTDSIVAERVRQLARQLDAEEYARSETDTEVAASDFGQGIARGLQQGGLPTDDATVASLARELQGRLKHPKR